MEPLDILGRLGAVEPPEITVTARVNTLLEEVANSELRSESSQGNRRHLGRRTRLAVVLLVAAALIAAVIGLRGGGQGGPLRTSWQSGSTYPATATNSAHAVGTWKLLDDVLSGKWQQNTSGPPPGYASCPTISTCYVLSGHWNSVMAGAKLLSESLYVTYDRGTTWLDLPIPQGFDPTSSLACADASDCAAGGTYNGQPVLLLTVDGGHSFTLEPLPSGVGEIFNLSCPTSLSCAGLAGSITQESAPSNVTFISTGDGGSSFVDYPIRTNDSMQDLSCSSPLDCTAAGTVLAQGDGSTGVTATTTDGGRTWTGGSLPSGFELQGGTSAQLSCADSLHCSLIGLIAIPNISSAECPTILPPPTSGSSTITRPQSPEVQAISNYEALVATAAEANEKSYGSVTCVSGPTMLVSDVASTTNGGLTWTPEMLPSDVPQPQLSGISCPTSNECWIAGSDAAPQVVPSSAGGSVSSCTFDDPGSTTFCAVNSGSSVLLGTTDGGATWSRVVFSIPSGVPNFDGQSFLSISSISCPSATVCGALGDAAQSSRSAPFYSLVTSSAQTIDTSTVNTPD
ncbi:MAG: hypothetical protein WA359_01900 [Acidimicrobiales bacterium]